MPAAALPKIVLLAQKDPSKQVELGADEGPFESWLAVVQDMWGAGNLTPLDTVFASRAIGAMAPTQNAYFGTVSYQFGRRLFTFCRESNIRIDAFEGESTLTQMERRPKDKVKFTPWTAGKKLLGSKRFTHLAVLSPSRLKEPHDALVAEAAVSLKKDGSLFFADLMASKTGVELPGAPKLHTEGEYREWLDASGLIFYAEYDMAADVRVALLSGLHHSLNMLANARKLHEPWRAQRLNAFERELEFAVTLHTAMERGDVAAKGLYYIKKERAPDAAAA